MNPSKSVQVDENAVECSLNGVESPSTSIKPNSGLRTALSSDVTAMLLDATSEGTNGIGCNEVLSRFRLAGVWKVRVKLCANEMLG